MLKQASPTMKVSDMRRALAFYETRLGFRCTFKLEDELHPEIPYAIVERDQVEIHLQLAPQAAGSSACYVTVDQVDALYAELRKAGATITRAIENSSYGVRDFNLADVDGNTIGFGEPNDGR